jgi:indolepyruvate ferredoxin oxidoreductase alpha subunit
VANAVFNQQDSILVILENGYTSATGQQANPSTGKNPRGQPVRMSIADTIKSLGVSWLRVVDPYRVGDTLQTIREAMTTAAGGLKVIIARAECQLERQRRVRPQIAAQLKAGARVETPRFGVDPDVCTGDKSCMRFNGCPSLTLGESGDPLRDDPWRGWIKAAWAAGCAERWRTRRSCAPRSTRRALVHHPGRWERALARLRGGVIGWLQTA